MVSNALEAAAVSASWALAAWHAGRARGAGWAESCACASPGINPVDRVMVETGSSSWRSCAGKVLVSVCPSSFSSPLLRRVQGECRGEREGATTKSQICKTRPRSVHPGSVFVQIIHITLSCDFVISASLPSKTCSLDPLSPRVVF